MCGRRGDGGEEDVGERGRERGREGVRIRKERGEREGGREECNC